MEERSKFWTTKKDRYGGVINRVDVTSPPVDETAFREELEAHLRVWEEGSVRGVWMVLDPSHHPHLIAPVLRSGFAFHHADEREAVLCRWLPRDTPSSLPHAMTHFVGAAGLVFHPERPYDVLTISERFESKLRYKIPGGLVDQGESIAAAAVREVLEETGIVTRRDTARVLLFRDRQDYQFDKCDLYVVLLLEAVTVDIHIDQKEITFCEWHDVRKTLESPDLYLMNRHLFEIALSLAHDRAAHSVGGEGAGIQPNVFHCVTLPSTFKPENLHDFYLSGKFVHFLTKEKAHI
jgi:8-oxo-dGTP diphosphatase